MRARLPRMKSASSLFFSSFLAFFAQASNSVQITTLNGELVDVSSSEVYKAAQKLKGFSTNYDKVYLNDDGSVSIVNPKVSFENVKYLFSYSSNPYAICARYGYMTVTQVENQEGASIGTAIYKSPDGVGASAVVGVNKSIGKYYIAKISCKTPIY